MNFPEEALWKEFVSNQDYLPVQFLLEWKNSVEKTYKNCSFFSYFHTEEGKINSILPFFLVKSNLFGKRFISQPFADFGGLIGNFDKGYFINAIQEIKKEFGEECKHIEIRLNDFSKSYDEMKSVLVEEGFEKKEGKQQIIIDLSNESEESFWNKIDRDGRKGVSKSKTNNFKITEIDSMEEVEKFYSLYFNSMKNFGTPQHSIKFFSELFENKVLSGFNCYLEKDLAASLILLCGKNYAYVAFNLTSPDYLKLRPNDVLYWKTICWTIRNKIKYLDLGQVQSDAPEGSHAAGIYNFKKKWGGKIYERPYFYYSPMRTEKGMNKERYSFLIGIWKHLPNFIIKIMGPKIASQLAL